MERSWAGRKWGIGAAGLIALLMLVAVYASACGSQETTTTGAPATSTSSAPATEATDATVTTTAKVAKIGITVIVDHPVLALVEKTFKERMAELGWVEGQNVEYETKNAQGDAASAAPIAKQFVDAKKDLVFGLGTPSIQAMAKETKDIPIVFAAMTDPVGAGVAVSLEKPGGNVTGVTDWVDPKMQFDLVLEAYPDTKTIGVILNLSEASSKAWLDAAEPIAKEMNLKLTTVPVAGTGDLQAAAESLVGRVDVMLMPGDNTTASGMQVIAKTAITNKIPLFAHGAEETAAQQVLIAIGMDYSKQGVLAADLADEILKGAYPGDLPVLSTPELAVVVNTRTVQAIGAQLPDSIMSRAITVDN
ncbi:MAG: ABC transporter substrate-binding protein [Thermoleophilia bacterium]|nr:ABC transporter substrate-binding protein [Thermoleophilia bacterium]